MQWHKSIKRIILYKYNPNIYTNETTTECTKIYSVIS